MFTMKINPSIYLNHHPMIYHWREKVIEKQNVKDIW
jgi:hypothetical protein